MYYYETEHSNSPRQLPESCKDDTTALMMARSDANRSYSPLLIVYYEEENGKFRTIWEQQKE